jgi:hypothetical protein
MTQQHTPNVAQAPQRRARIVSKTRGAAYLVVAAGAQSNLILITTRGASTQQLPNRPNGPIIRLLQRLPVSEREF